MDQRTKKSMTIHKAKNPRDDIDRLYESRKEGKRGLTTIKDDLDETIQRTEEYAQKKSE